MKENYFLSCRFWMVSEGASHLHVTVDPINFFLKADHDGMLGHILIIMYSPHTKDVAITSCTDKNLAL